MVVENGIMVVVVAKGWCGKKDMGILNPNSDNIVKERIMCSYWPNGRVLVFDSKGLKFEFTVTVFDIYITKKKRRSKDRRMMNSKLCPYTGKKDIGESKSQVGSGE